MYSKGTIGVMILYGAIWKEASSETAKDAEN